jgi:hypothetical protein
MPFVRELPMLFHPLHELPPLMSTRPPCAAAQVASAEIFAAQS